MEKVTEGNAKERMENDEEGYHDAVDGYKKESIIIEGVNGWYTLRQRHISLRTGWIIRKGEVSGMTPGSVSLFAIVVSSCMQALRP
jgi:hypothetical protein